MIHPISPAPAPAPTPITPASDAPTEPVEQVPIHSKTVPAPIPNTTPTNPVLAYKPPSQAPRSVY